MATPTKATYFANDIGKSIEFKVWNWDETLATPAATLLDISAATAQDITFLKPDGTTLEVSGEFLTDGTDSISRYLTEAGDLTAGSWEGQLKLTFPDGTHHSTIIEFEVEANL